jgi:hypothetical protein
MTKKELAAKMREFLMTKPNDGFNECWGHQRQLHALPLIELARFLKIDPDNVITEEELND